MRYAAAWLVSWTALAMLGCGGGDTSHGTGGDPGPDFVDGFDPPAPAADEIQVVSPSLGMIKPGDDVNFCTYLDYDVEKDYDVVGFHIYQATTGHHAVLYMANEARPVGTHECTDADMFNVRFVAGGGATAPTVDVPDGLAFRMKKGTQLMFQTHWLNTSHDTHEAQAVANVRVVDPSEGRILSDLFTVNDTTFNVPIGAVQENTTSCAAKEDLQIWYLAGHAHEYTKKVAIDHVAGDASKRLYTTTPWLPEYVTDAPANTYSKDNPLLLKKGESFRVTCTVDNTYGMHPLVFPTEMCAALGFYFPSHGEMDCSDGVWAARAGATN